jgi:cytochrome c-type biogenesis protein
MLALLSALSTWLYGAAWAALPAAFLWGVASVLLSPCHLAGIPLVIGYVSGRAGSSYRDTAFSSLLFALGILLTLAVIGLATGLLGAVLGATGGWLTVLVGAFVLVFGLYLAGLLPERLLEFSTRPKSWGRGPLPALMLGLVFGLALGPCSFAFLAPLIGIAFSISSSAVRPGAAASGSPLYSVSLFLFYALGHCLVILLAGLLTERVKRYLAWSQRSGAPLALRRVSGGLVMAAGAYMIASPFV